MILQPQARSRAFDESIGLLLKLHALFRVGLDESPEADAIRDQMDHPWYQLSENEQQIMRGLSADLYTVEGNGSDDGVGEVSPPFAADALARFQDALRSEDWVEALNSIRDNQAALPASEAAYSRGVCWMHLKRPNVALEFLLGAERLGRRDSFLEFVILTCFLEAERIAEALPRAQRILETSSHPLLVIRAASILAAAAIELGSHSRQDLANLAIAGFEHGLALADAPLSDPLEQELVVDQRVSAHIQLGILHEMLGHTKQSIAQCERALGLDPNNCEALALYGWLLRNGDSREHAQTHDDHFLRKHQRLVDFPSEAFVNSSLMHVMN